MDNNFDKLPLEIVVIILENITAFNERMNLKKVCRKFRDVTYAFLSQGEDLRQSRIDDDGLQHFQGVREINLARCSRITDSGLRYLKGVHTIKLSRCRQITNAGLQHLQGVHTIKLSHCGNITDAGLRHLQGVYAPSKAGRKSSVRCTLDTINLSHCGGITDVGLQYLQGVHTINLSNCDQITDTGLKYLRGIHTPDVVGRGSREQNSIDTIDITNCTKITRAGLDYIRGTRIINSTGINYSALQSPSGGDGCHAVKPMCLQKNLAVERRRRKALPGT